MSDTTTINSGCPESITVPISISPSSLSGYTRISEFTFTPKLTGDFADRFYKDISSVKVVWDFGDGYVLSASTPYESTHIYNYPGYYTATLFFYDNKGDALLNTLTQTISVYNYFTNKIKFVEKETPYFKSSILSNDNELPYFVQTTWQDYNPEGNVVYFAASGTNITDLYDETYKYAFLLPFRSFYNQYGNRIRSKSIILEPKYYYLNGETPTLTTSDASGAVILGAMGSDSVYYFDDSYGNRRIFAALDTSKHTLPDYYINNIETNLNLTNKNYFESNIDYIDIISLSAVPTNLVLTSTGNKKMSLPKLKRQGDAFRVWVAAGDSDNNIYKFNSQFYYSSGDYISGNIGAFNAEILSGDELYSTDISSISSSKFTYSSNLSSSYLSSFVYFNYIPTEPGDFVFSVSGIPSSDSGILTGSYTFTVYPSSNTDYYKINELTFDYSETIKSYRFQDFLNKYDTLFDGVIGAIVGVASSSPTSYGKTIYEKISNFVLNNSDVDTCNINVLKNFYSLFNENPNFYINTAPPELQRLIDLYSIRLKRLIGGMEKFDRSFDTFYNSGSAHAKNIDYSSPIDIATYTVSADNKFVAIQKFNNESILIEPQKIAGSHSYPTSGLSLSSYPLSAFNINSNWGWRLDSSLSGLELSALYDFYPYTEYFTNTKKNNILDHTQNEYNTLSTSTTAISSWDGDTGSIYTSINNQIRKGLNL